MTKLIYILKIEKKQEWSVRTEHIRKHLAYAKFGKFAKRDDYQVTLKIVSQYLTVIVDASYR